MEWWEKLEIDLETPLAADVVAHLETQATDVRARVQLVLHYNVAARSTREDELAASEAALVTHLLWLIEHHPEISLISVNLSKAAHAHCVVDAWLSAVERAPNRFRVAYNALSAIRSLDHRRAEALVDQVRATAGSNPEHLWHLGSHWMHLWRIARCHDERVRTAREAMACFSVVRDLDPLQRFAVGIDLVQSMVAAGAHERADELARELLAEAHEHERTWYYGNAIHHAHLALGEIARARGDLAAAAHHLEAAGATPGSPQLNTFGPDFALARALLEAGARDAVLAFLDGCSRFWNMDDGQLAAWRTQIELGECPLLDRFARAQVRSEETS